LAERFAIQKHGRHGHDLARFDFTLEQRAVDHHALDIGVERGHQVQRLHNIRAVVAGERNKGFKPQAGIQTFDLFDDACVDLGRIAADLQKREHEGRELMAHRDAGKMHARRLAGQRDAKRRFERSIAAFTHGDFIRKRGDFFDELADFRSLGAGIE